jgi:hypothetical protein
MVEHGDIHKPRWLLRFRLRRNQIYCELLRWNILSRRDMREFAMVCGLDGVVAHKGPLLSYTAGRASLCSIERRSPGALLASMVKKVPIQRG